MCGTPDLKNSFYVQVPYFLNQMRNGSSEVKQYDKWAKYRFSWSLPSLNFTPLVLEGIGGKSLPFMNWNENPFEVK